MRELPTTWDAIFWDIGGVILDHDSVRTVHRTFVEALLNRYGRDDPAVDPLDTWREAVGNHFHQRDGNEFRCAEDAYHLGVEAVLGSSLDRTEWQPLFDETFTEHIEPEPEAVSTLTTLAERDIHVGIVSDIDDREATAILDDFGIESAVDSVTTSEAVGRTKPDRQMFDTALEAASVPAERSLMIGDRYSHDMRGGSEAGLWTIAYGADGGPAVDFRAETLSDVLAIVDGDHANLRED